MSKKNAIYKYDAKVKHRSWDEYALSVIPFIIFLIVFLIKPIIPIFFIGVVITIILSSILFSRHNHMGTSINTISLRQNFPLIFF